MRHLSILLIITLSVSAQQKLETWVFPVDAKWLATLVPADIANTETPQQILEYLGVPFPDGTHAHALAARKELSIRNTPANLQRIDRIFDVRGAYPKQVEIVLLVIEVSPALAGAWGLDGGPPAEPKSTPLGKAIPSVLSSKDATLVINGLRKEKEATVVSTASVVTISGNVAVTKAPDERFFPQGWSEPTLEKKDPKTKEKQTVIVPSQPQFGGATEVGVILTVSPMVSKNGRYIDLSLTPEVIMAVGWDQYSLHAQGEPLPATKMPVIRKRSCDTKVVIADGATVMLASAKPDISVSMDEHSKIIPDKQVTLMFVTGRLLPMAPENYIRMEEK